MQKNNNNVKKLNTKMVDMVNNLLLLEEIHQQLDSILC